MGLPNGTRCSASAGIVTFHSQRRDEYRPAGLHGGYRKRQFPPFTRATWQERERRRTQPVQVKVSAAWREINFGDWEGLTYAEITAQYTGQLGFLTDPEHYSPPRGESLAHMLQRVRAGLATIVCSDDVSLEGDVVIVSHGGPLRALLCSVLEIPLERQWLLRLDHGSLSAIDLLPVHEPPVPRAILALLNAQRPAWKKR